MESKNGNVNGNDTQILSYNEMVNSINNDTFSEMISKKCVDIHTNNGFIMRYLIDINLVNAEHLDLLSEVYDSFHFDKDIIMDNFSYFLYDTFKKGDKFKAYSIEEKKYFYYLEQYPNFYYKKYIRYNHKYDNNLNIEKKLNKCFDLYYFYNTKFKSSTDDNSIFNYEKDILCKILCFYLHKFYFLEEMFYDYIKFINVIEKTPNNFIEYSFKINDFVNNFIGTTIPINKYNYNEYPNKIYLLKIKIFKYLIQELQYYSDEYVISSKSSKEYKSHNKLNIFLLINYIQEIISSLFKNNFTYNIYVKKNKNFNEFEQNTKKIFRDINAINENDILRLKKKIDFYLQHYFKFLSFELNNQIIKDILFFNIKNKINEKIFVGYLNCNGKSEWNQLIHRYEFNTNYENERRKLNVQESLINSRLSLDELFFLIQLLFKIQLLKDTFCIFELKQYIQFNQWNEIIIDRFNDILKFILEFGDKNTFIYKLSNFVNSQKITNDIMENSSFDNDTFNFDENVIELYKKYPKTVLLFKKTGLIFKKTNVMEIEANRLLKSILISTNVKKYENYDLTLKNALFVSSITSQKQGSVSGSILSSVSHSETITTHSQIPLLFNDKKIKKS